MKRQRALEVLTQAFHGRLPSQPDWMELMEAANNALVTPRLQAVVAGTPRAEPIPADAAAFLELIVERNDARNRRLRELALAAVEAINASDVTPVYLKGMAVWASCAPESTSFARMMSDVDLLIRPEEADAAIDGLLARGFKVLRRFPSEHVCAELYREGDVGVLDLHRRPPGPKRLTALFDLHRHTSPAPWEGRARLPFPAHQIFLMCLHDMLHDGGFWRGGFDVRHLCDIADLAGGPQGVDWAAFKDLLRTRLVRDVIFSQIVAANRIAAAPVPPDISRRIIPRIQYHRHRAQYLYPRLRAPLGLLGVALEAHYLSDGRSLTSRDLLWWRYWGRDYPNKL